MCSLLWSWVKMQMAGLSFSTESSQRALPFPLAQERLLQVDL